MKRQSDYGMNEWAWFLLQLRVEALEQSVAPGYSVKYWVEDSGSILCQVMSTLTERVVRAEKAEQEECFRNWWIVQCELLGPIITAIPSVAAKIDCRRDIVLEVMEDDGMGVRVVCCVQDGNVHLES